ncbi:S9 family peptidase [Alicyclobacillus vulcanalis]|uniref:Oligopeptidase B Serine peptidase. MEROPS family S09A n=1 Tax=Alicyclobacillus vulcanalis TaxID=252246 RepID=A0A1N7M5G6_9BACL|nr:S9 family peptidase [Alicyclobacillus vulcanalis]SIS81334.1 oligopeptidase B Serine peptidase. MEROPS family S09A [Alicyclobacillus vulcanalis]
MEAPKAKAIPTVLEIHNDRRVDPYYWLRDRDNPDVIRYLEDENTYYRWYMERVQPLTDELYEAMVARIPDAEERVPVQGDQYYYYTRMEKSLQYPIHARKRAESREALAQAEEEIILDVNQIAGNGYLSVSMLATSPDEKRLAYLENRDGTDRYTLLVKDLDSGQDLPDRIENVFIDGSLAWSADGQYLFYITVDEAQRPYRLYRHRLGDPVEQDALLYEEEDETCILTLAKSQSGKYLFLTSSTKTTTEVRYLPADQPLGTWTVFRPRQAEVEYELEHWENAFLVLTNLGRRNFSVFRHPIAPCEDERLEELFPYDEARYLTAVHPFREAVVIEGREGGLTQIWTFADGRLTRLSWDEPLFTVSVSTNRRYDTREVLIQYESFLTPRTTYALDPVTGERKALLRQPVNGPYDPADYVQERLFAHAQDGTRIPISLVYRKGARDAGPAPCILYGYGSYGHNLDPTFSPVLLLPLLDKGVIYAIAHVRGGSEMGRPWYEDGKLLAKKNTFTDFIACADALIQQAYTSPEKLAADGRSAGGLLMGAVANMGGDRFAAISAGVPFVDVVTTMLDPTIPLTTLEWDEWGDPRDETYYFYMKSYSPYDNVEAKRYPHLIVTTGLNDPRVAYWEPAKWVAKLRTTKVGDEALVLKTHMGAGHFGSSGRLEHLRESAEIHAFLLHHIGVSPKPSAAS